ncbi:MAG: hypothetical protein ABS944_11725 [Solibacillus sp.]|uniref:hypothetical protein n=1 Tax=unclassified Solibacillus TaxID=2637870 RepID=UPI0030F621D5
MTPEKKQLEEKINELQQQTKYYVLEFKDLLSKLHINKDIQLISYFTSSLNISQSSEEESVCLGSYHIWNIGNVPIINPSITIQLPENSPFTFTGRYVYNHFHQGLKRPNEWLRIKNPDNKDIYSFKPLEKTVLEPNEKITFENFQIKWLSNTPYSGSITGFTYCEQLQEGIPVVNPINLSIVGAEKEE